MKIIELEKKSQVADFIEFSSRIPRYYKLFDTPDFLQRLLLGRFPAKKKHLLMAYEAGEPVARVAFKLHIENGEEVLNFGFFEALPNSHQAVKELFDHIQKKYPEHKIIGPYHFRMEDPFTGMLVSGEKKSPTFLMSYNPEYYDELLQAAGLSKAMDLASYYISNQVKIPEKMKEKSAKTQALGISIRWADKKNLKLEAKKIIGIFNNALDGNWGFEQIDDAQAREMYLFLKTIIDPNYLAFAHKDGVDIGCLIMIPNYNNMMTSRNRAFWDLIRAAIFRKRQDFQTVRGYALGVKKQYHSMGVGNLLFEKMWSRCLDLSCKGCEISWILGNNQSMNGLMQHAGIEPSKTYRIYSK